MHTRLTAHVPALALLAGSLLLGGCGPAPTPPVEPTPAAVIGAGDRYSSLEAAASFLVDPSRELAIDEIDHAPGATFTPYTHGGVPYNAGAPASLWVRATVINDGPPDAWYLVLDLPPTVNDVTVYLPATAGSELGPAPAWRELHLAQDAVADRAMSFPVFLPAGATTLYLRIDPMNSRRIPLSLRSPDAFALERQGEHTTFGVLQGAMLILALFHLIIWCSLRDRNALLIALFAIGFWLFVAISYSMYPFSALRDALWFIIVLQRTGLMLSVAAPLLLALTFLPFKTELPRVHRALLGSLVFVGSDWVLDTSITLLTWSGLPVGLPGASLVTGGLLACVCLATAAWLRLQRVPWSAGAWTIVAGIAVAALTTLLPGLLPVYTAFLLRFALLDLPLLVTLLAAVVVLRRGHEPARIFLLAWSLFAVTFIIGTTVDLIRPPGIAAWPFITSGAIAAVLLWSLALSERVRASEHDRGEAQATVIREQEAKLRLQEQVTAAATASEHHYRHILDAVHVGVFVASGGQLRYANATLAALSGFPGQALSASRDVLGLFTPEDQRALAPVLLSDTPPLAPLVHERRLQRQDGSCVEVMLGLQSVELAGDQPGVVGTLLDLRERRRLEQQVLQAQRLEALGRLTGGVAHDFNNLLTVINGYGSLVQESLPAESEVRREVGLIIDAGRRASKLTRQLLAFSRRQILMPQLLQLNEVATRSLTLLERSLGEDIELQVQLQPGLGPILADEGQVEQVLLNLILNARDAMPRGGELRIQTDDVLLASDDILEPGLPGGAYIRLEISDTGHGMDEATRARIFEPYFTTKPTGEGTGLGLATVHGIVTQSGGHIVVRSTPGEGASFQVYFPRATAGAAPGGEEQDQGAQGRSELVLLVEDEASVRELVATVLRAHDYRVYAVANPAALLDDRPLPERPQLLLTDVVMPGMSGRELAERLRTLRPELPVLYMSGYTDDALLRHGVARGAEHILLKPFSTRALLRSVRAALDQAAGQLIPDRAP